MGNSHAALGKLPVPTEVPGEEAKSPTAEDVQLPMGEGEKSVLQAKLTNLATLNISTIQKNYQDKCKIRIVYFVLLRPRH